MSSAPRGNAGLRSLPLPVDQPIQGPAIVEQRESTAVVGPSGTAHVDANGNLVINIL